MAICLCPKGLLLQKLYDEIAKYYLPAFNQFRLRIGRAELLLFGINSKKRLDDITKIVDGEEQLFRQGIQNLDNKRQWAERVSGQVHSTCEKKDSWADAIVEMFRGIERVDQALNNGLKNATASYCSSLIVCRNPCELKRVGKLRFNCILPAGANEDSWLDPLYQLRAPTPAKWAKEFEDQYLGKVTPAVCPSAVGECKTEADCKDCQSVIQNTAESIYIKYMSGSFDAKTKKYLAGKGGLLDQLSAKLGFALKTPEFQSAPDAANSYGTFINNKTHNLRGIRYVISQQQLDLCDSNALKAFFLWLLEEISDIKYALRQLEAGQTTAPKSERVRFSAPAPAVRNKMAF